MFTKGGPNISCSLFYEFISYNFPVYSIALGDTNIYKDIGIDNVLINDISFLGNSFPLEVSLASKLENLDNSKLIILNNVEKVHEEIVKDASVVDLGLIFGIGFPPFRGGLLRYADSEGLGRVLEAIENYADKVSADRYDPSPYLRNLVKNNKKFYDLCR